MTSDNINPWDEPTRWDATRDPDEPPAPADPAAGTAAPPPVPPAPAVPPAHASSPVPPPAPDLPVFGTPTAPTPPSPASPPAAPVPPVITPPMPTTPSPPAAPVVSVPPPVQPPVAPGSAIGSQPLPTMPAPAAPAGQPLLTGNYGGTPEPVVAAPAPSGNGRFAWIAAIVGAVALLGGGAFFALTAFGASGGGETPEDAVDQMLVAINGEDFLTVGELLDPAERRTLVEPVLTDILPELQRLGVFDDSLDPSDVDGVDLELADVTYRIDPLADDLHAVYFTSGTASSEATAAEFPWGDAIRDRFGDNLEDSPRETDEITDDGTPLMLVEREGRWYFSMWHSVAEQARLESGDSLPLVGDMPIALGSDTPAEAIEAMIQEMVDLDIRSVVGRMDPAEAAALYRYSPIFLGEAEGELNNLRREAAEDGVSWTVTNLEFDTDEDGDDAVVTIRAFTVTVTTPDLDLVVTWSPEMISVELDATFDGESITGSLEITPRRWSLNGSGGGESVDLVVQIDADAETISLTGDVSGESVEGMLSMDSAGVCSEYSFRGMDANESGCFEELFEEAGVDAGLSQFDVTQAFANIDTEYPGIPMATHRTDGRWYVSPTMSVMNAVSNGLAEVSREDFEQFLDDLEDTSESFTIEDIIEAPFDAADDAPFGVLDLGNDDDVFDAIEDEGFVTEDPTVEDPTFVDPTSEDFSIVGSTEPQLLQGELDRNETHRYTVSMQAGQTIGVTLYGSGLDGIGDPVLSFDDPDGFEVAYNDDSDGLNSAFVYTAERDGDHVIMVRELGGSPGVYDLGFEIEDEGGELAIIDVEAQDDGSTFGLTPVASGSLETTAGSTLSIGDSLESGTFDVYDLNVSEPLQLTITVLGETGTEVDTNVSVFDADGTLIGYNDDASADVGLENFYDSHLVVDVPAGAHTIEIHSFGDNDTGGYELTIVAN